MLRFLLLMLFSTTVSMSVATAQVKDSSIPNRQKPAWLGIWVAPPGAVLVSHLPDLLKVDEGLLVGGVKEASPAAEAGIAQYDILLNFNGHKLARGDQLTQLLQDSEAGTEVMITLIQGGQLTKKVVRLGERPESHAAIHGTRHGFPPSFPVWMTGNRPGNPHFFSSGSIQASGWDRFESIEVKTLGRNLYQAHISYKDRNNEVQTFSFEGSKPEIVQQIMKLNELPEHKKQKLLNAMNRSLPTFFPPGLGNSFFSYQRLSPFYPMPYFQPNFRHPWNR